MWLSIVHPIHLRESSSMARWRCERCGHAITPAELAMGNRGPDPTHWIVWHWVWADLENDVVIRAPFHFVCWVEFFHPFELGDLPRLGGS
jgi:hypothetical protein